MLSELRARYPEMKVIVITAYGEQEKLGLIRELRRDRGLTQESLQRRRGLPQSYISDLKRGKRNVSLRNLYRLARALEVPSRSSSPERAFIRISDIGLT